MVIYNVKDRTELLSRVGGFEGESVRQEDIDLTYTWTNTQGVDNGGTVINVGTGSWVNKYKGSSIFTPTYEGNKDLSKSIVPELGNGTTYYFSTSGDDSNDGLTEVTPKRTLYNASVNIQPQPGDNILLKRGDVWNNERLFFYDTVPVFGTEANRITFADYGDITLPIPKMDGKILTTGFVADSVANVYKITKSYIYGRYWLDGVEVLMARSKDELSEYQPFYASGTEVFMYSLTDPSNHTIELAGAAGIYCQTSNDYIIYKNLEVVNSYDEAFKMNGSSHNIITNCVFGSGCTGGASMTAINGVYSNYNLFIDCIVKADYKFDYSGVDNSTNVSDAFGTGDGFFIHDGASHNKVINCYIENWGHASLNMNEQTGRDTSFNEFMNNYITGPDCGYGGRIGFSGTNCSNNVISGNIIKDIGVRFQFAGTNNKVVNNVIDTVTDPTVKLPDKKGQGMNISGYNGAANGLVVANNTIMNTDAEAIWVVPGNSVIKNTLITRNIIYNCGSDSVAIRLQDGMAVNETKFIDNLFYDDRGVRPLIIDQDSGSTPLDIDHLNSVGLNTDNKIIDVGLLPTYESKFDFISKYYGYKRSVR